MVAMVVEFDVVVKVVVEVVVRMVRGRSSDGGGI